jgi:hypothetical protein
MAASTELNTILRDAAKTPLLRMTECLWPRSHPRGVENPEIIGKPIGSDGEIL